VLHRRDDEPILRIPLDIVERVCRQSDECYWQFICDNRAERLVFVEDKSPGSGVNRSLFSDAIGIVGLRSMDNAALSVDLPANDGITAVARKNRARSGSWEFTVESPLASVASVNWNRFTGIVLKRSLEGARVYYWRRGYLHADTAAQWLSVVLLAYLFLTAVLDSRSFWKNRRKLWPALSSFTPTGIREADALAIGLVVLLLPKNSWLVFVLGTLMPVLIGVIIGKSLVAGVVLERLKNLPNPRTESFQADLRKLRAALVVRLALPWLAVVVAAILIVVYVFSNTALEPKLFSSVVAIIGTVVVVVAPSMQRRSG
jgi:hypothetical protein